MATLILDIDNDLDKEQIIAHISMLKGINKVSIVDDCNNCSAWDETNYLCSIPEMRESIIEGMNTLLDECVPLEEIWPDV
jgi:hypothetical protein